MAIQIPRLLNENMDDEVDKVMSNLSTMNIDDKLKTETLVQMSEIMDDKESYLKRKIVYLT